MFLFVDKIMTKEIFSELLSDSMINCYQFYKDFFYHMTSLLFSGIEIGKQI